MKVYAAFLNYNELDIIRLTIKHYQSIADKVFVFDNYSTDGSDVLAEELGCKVIKFGKPGVLDDFEYLKVKNNPFYFIKEPKPDWMIICDCDEILDITREDLEREMRLNTTVIRTNGFNIYSNHMPKECMFEVNTGFDDPNFSKWVCYNPLRVHSMGYQLGAHFARPMGLRIFSKKTYNLLHYKCIGGPLRVAAKHHEYLKRLPEHKNRSIAAHYRVDYTTFLNEFEYNRQRARPYEPN